MDCKVIKSRWSNFSGLTIFEFSNQDKVTFFLARISPNFSSLPLPNETCVLPFNLMLERDPKNIFYYQLDIENYMDQVLMNIHKEFSDL